MERHMSSTAKRGCRERPRCQPCSQASVWVLQGSGSRGRAHHYKNAAVSVRHSAPRLQPGGQGGVGGDHVPHHHRQPHDQAICARLVPHLQLLHAVVLHPHQLCRRICWRRLLGRCGAAESVQGCCAPMQGVCRQVLAEAFLSCISACSGSNGWDTSCAHPLCQLTQAGFESSAAWQPMRPEIRLCRPRCGRKQAGTTRDAWCDQVSRCRSPQKKVGFLTGLARLRAASSRTAS